MWDQTYKFDFNQYSKIKVKRKASIVRPTDTYVPKGMCANFV